MRTPQINITATLCLTPVPQGPLPPAQKDEKHPKVDDPLLGATRRQKTASSKSDVLKMTDYTRIKILLAFPSFPFPSSFSKAIAEAHNNGDALETNLVARRLPTFREHRVVPGGR